MLMEGGEKLQEPWGTPTLACVPPPPVSGLLPRASHPSPAPLEILPLPPPRTAWAGLGLPPVLAPSDWSEESEYRMCAAIKAAVENNRVGKVRPDPGGRDAWPRSCEGLSWKGIPARKPCQRRPVSKVSTV